MKKFYVYALLDSRKPGKFIYDEYIFDYEPFYIGKGTKYRINSHFYPSSLKVKNRKSNKIKAILNSGYEVIRLKLIDNLSEEQALLIESNIIKSIGRIDNISGILTNLTDGGDGTTSLIIEKTRKTVYKICPDTLSVICKYDSITIAANDINSSPSNITACCKGHRGCVTHKGFMWSYTEDVKRFDLCKKAIDLIDDSGNVIKVYNSSAEASRELCIQQPAITKCCLGELICTHGYRFEYHDPILKEKFKRSINKITTARKVYQKVDGVYIVHNSVKEAALYNNISVSMVIMVCKGKRSRKKYWFEYEYVDV